MAHELEIVNGEASFASREVAAWHRLGTVFQGDKTTTEMLEAAALNDWNVRLVHLSEVLDFDTYAKDQYLVVRDNPGNNGQGVLAVVGDRYNVVQNEQAFSFADTILDGGGRWETAGSIKNGTVIFGSLSFDSDVITLDPNGAADKINKYLMVTTSHDGTSAVVAAKTNVRVVCANTLNFALRGVKQQFKIRHTQSVDGKIAAAREALAISHAYDEVFEAEAMALMAVKADAAMFDKIVSTIYPRPEEDVKGAFKKYDTLRDTIDEVYASATIDNIRGTAWGVMNALTERVDYYRTARANSPQGILLGASGFDVNTNRQRQEIFDKAKAVALA